MLVIEKARTFRILRKETLVGGVYFHKRVLVVAAGGLRAVTPRRRRLDDAAVRTEGAIRKTRSIDSQMPSSIQGDIAVWLGKM